MRLFFLFQEGRSMNPKRFSYEHILFLTAFVIALVIRFYQLGKAPLTDEEAYWANQALMVSKGETNLEMGPNPGYILLTGFIFSFFGSSEFTARLLPVLAGCLVILIPWIVRLKIRGGVTQRVGLLILAFGLALDPGLGILARQAGGPMMAISFAIAALVFFFLGNAIASGVFTGLALLSGPAIYPGLLSLGIAGAIVLYWKKRSPVVLSNDGAPINDVFIKGTGEWKTYAVRFFLAAFGTILIIGTFFFKYPQGIGAWLSSLQVYLEGWRLSSGTPIGLTFMAWIVFELLALIFFLSAFIRLIIQYINDQARISLLLIFIYFWLVFALLLVVVYPSREVTELGWTIIPLWFIAAGELAILLPVKNVSPISVILALFTFILMSLFWFTLSAISKLPATNYALDMRLLVPVGVLILLGLSAALVSLGWTSEVAQKGLAWGMCGALLIYSFSALSGAAYQRSGDPVELWGSLPGSGQNDLFEQTLGDISRQLTGIVGFADIIATPDSQSLRWALRNYHQARFVNAPPTGELPSVVITPAEQESPELAAAYTGQDFVWWTWRGWSGTLPPNPIQWLNYREAPVQNQKIILWIRSDLLPGAASAPSEIP
jgi:hypothetical protein